MITISGFRHPPQIAKRALSKLIQDGRIHPDASRKRWKKPRRTWRSTSRGREDALYELGNFHGRDRPEMIQILGRFKYPTSYGQNALMHSRKCRASPP